MSEPTKVGAKTGKAKGAAQVKTKKVPPINQKNIDDAAELVTDAAVDEAIVEAGEGNREALYAGNAASVKGHPSKPPHDYSPAEQRAWYVGYNAHANPKTTAKVGEGTYLGKYSDK